jgi:hypothetical protein
MEHLDVHPVFCEVNFCKVLSIFAEPTSIFTILCISAEAFRQFVSKLGIHLTEHFHRPRLQTTERQRRVKYVTQHNYDITFYGFMIY